MPASPTSPSPIRRRTYFLLGIVFELVLLLLCFLLPGSWLQVEIRNFTIIAHLPVEFIMAVLFEGSELLGLLGMILGFVLMACVWGGLIYLVQQLVARILNRFVVSPGRKRQLKWGCAGLGGLLLLWTVVANWPASPRPFKSSPEVQSVVQGNTAFALDFYQKLRDRPGNLFFSPYSISTSLALTYMGARGQTELEIAQVLHLNPAQTNLAVAFGDLETRMNGVQRWNRIELLTANSLWYQKDYQFEDDFLDLARRFFHAEVRSLDFRNPAASALEINGWIERQTRGRISAAVDPSQFTDLTRLVLCNAIYFKGKWQHQFKEHDTHPETFHVNTNVTVTVPMMSQEAELKVTTVDGAVLHLVELPYSGTDLSMVILLPGYDIDLPDVAPFEISDLESQLTTENLRLWLGKLDQTPPHKTWVYLPRFTTAQTFDLVKELKSLGMNSAFGESADFRGMDGTTNLFVADVLHKAFVEVNEAGTEAAAATIQLVAARSAASRFVVNRPFLFLIRDNASGSILFIGRIVDPTK